MCRGAGSLLPARLLPMDQIERRRALDDPRAESPAAKKRYMMAIFHAAFAADEKPVKHHGQWWGPVMKDSLARTTAPQWG